MLKFVKSLCVRGKYRLLLVRGAFDLEYRMFDFGFKHVTSTRDPLIESTIFIINKGHIYI
jgi:hypothetical protein